MLSLKLITLLCKYTKNKKYIKSFVRGEKKSSEKRAFIANYLYCNLFNITKEIKNNILSGVRKIIFEYAISIKDHFSTTPLGNIFNNFHAMDGWNDLVRVINAGGAQINPEVDIKGIDWNLSKMEEDKFIGGAGTKYCKISKLFRGNNKKVYYPKNLHIHDSSSYGPFLVRKMIVYRHVFLHFKLSKKMELRDIFNYISLEIGGAEIQKISGKIIEILQKLYGTKTIITESRDANNNIVYEYAFLIPMFVFMNKLYDVQYHEQFLHLKLTPKFDNISLDPEFRITYETAEVNPKTVKKYIKKLLKPKSKVFPNEDQLRMEQHIHYYDRSIINAGLGGLNFRTYMIVVFASLNGEIAFNAIKKIKLKILDKTFDAVAHPNFPGYFFFPLTNRYPLLTNVYDPNIPNFSRLDRYTYDIEYNEYSGELVVEEHNLALNVLETRGGMAGLQRTH